MKDGTKTFALQSLGIGIPENSLTQFVAEAQVDFATRLIQEVIRESNAEQVLEDLIDAKNELYTNNTKLYMEHFPND